MSMAAATGEAAQRPLVIVVGGHDPSGAGITADLSALTSLAVNAQSVVTAWTQQDHTGVRALGARPAREWVRELSDLLDKRSALQSGCALKFGLLPGLEHVRAAAAFVHALPAEVDVVVDPVLAASSGGRFLEAEAVAAVRTELCALPIVLTPNVVELAELTHSAVDRLAAAVDLRAEAAQTLLAGGCRGVVAKGGHGLEDPVLDLVLWRSQGEVQRVELRHPRVPGAKIRGSGCRYASRLAGELALGRDLATAARAASGLLSELLSTPGAPRGS